MWQCHKTLQANEKGRDFLVGDLHGMRQALDQALAARRFDPASDRLISIGDLIDRGPDSPACLQLLKEPWFYAVRGNHEEMMLYGLADEDFHQRWMANGGEWALGEADEALIHWHQKIATLPLALSLTCVDGSIIGLTHAQYPEADWQKVQDVCDDREGRHVILWGRTVICGNASGKTRNITLTVHGHTPVSEPLLIGNALFIDTGAVYGGDLTLITAEEALAYLNTNTRNQ